MGLAEELKKVLEHNPKLREQLAKQLAKTIGEPKAEKKVLQKATVEVEHHYKCKLCGITEVKVFKVELVNLKGHDTVFQDVWYCDSCPEHLLEYSKEQLVERMLYVVKRMSSPATGPTRGKQKQPRWQK